MELTLSPVSSKLNSLLAGTRIVKEFMKGANKIHTKFERDYLKLASICNPSKCANFKDLFENYLSYIKSFLRFNNNIITQTQIAYETLKRTSLELKSKISIIKVEKKTMKRMKDDKNDENMMQISKRCKDLLSDTSQLTKKHVEEAINSHLLSLKSLKKGVEIPSSHEYIPRKAHYNSSNLQSLDFEEELDLSIRNKIQSRTQKSPNITKNFRDQGLKITKDSMSSGYALHYDQDFSQSFKIVSK